jgi:hypothetical protein
MPLSEGVIEEMRAFQDYALDPAWDVPLAPHQLFGYRGRNGIRAYLERSEHTSCLAVYLPDGNRRAFNASHFGITEYAGGFLPGWLVYDENRLLALDPDRNYRFGEGTMPQEDFHLFSIPEGFALRRGVTGHGRQHYMMEFTADGPVRAVVPERLTELYANGRRLVAGGGGLEFAASGDTSLIAFGAGPELPLGLLNAMPWAVDGMAPGERTTMFTARGTGFFHHAGARASIVGRLPPVRPVVLKGQFIIDPEAKNGMVGSVHINGRQVLEVENTERPWRTEPFEADISEFAGRQVMIQFTTTGTGGYNYGGWEDFRVGTR